MRRLRIYNDGNDEIARRPADMTARDRLLTGVPAVERRLDVNGTATYVLEGGQGPPMVLLHGGIQSGGVYWGRVIARLAKAHRLVVPDVPGLGESEPMAQLNATTFADWLAAVLRLTCQEPPTLLAHSLNGSLAAQFASQRSHLLGRLVLSGTPGIGHYRMPPGLLIAAIRSNVRPSERNFERFLPWPFLDPDRTRQLDPEWFEAFSAYLRSRSAAPSVRRTMRQLIKAGTKQIPDSELRRINVPVSLIWGKHDRMAPVRLAESAKAKFGWPLHLVEGAGHVPFIEQPEQFHAVLAEATSNDGG
jgi:pimeloyl-ACP methyl ester carboxylesterase